MPLADRVLIDTSVFYALTSEADSFHQRAIDTYERLVDWDRELWTTSYILVETIALIHRRLGYAALAQLTDSLGRHLQIFWIESTVHSEAWRRLAANQGVGMSFVDWTTALASTTLGAPVFTFDRDFVREGISVLPVSNSQG
jgi:predicted nucleic acid-binding protein